MFWPLCDITFSWPWPCPPRPRREPLSAAGGLRLPFPAVGDPGRSPGKPEQRAGAAAKAQRTGARGGGGLLPLPGLLRPSFVSQPRAWLGPPGAGPEFGEITPPRKAHSASLRSEEGGCTEGRAGSGESGRGWGAVLTAGEGAGLRGQILGRPPGSRRPAPGATDSPFRPLCSAPSPAPFALAQLSHGSSSPSPARLPAATVAGLLAPTPASAHRPLPSGAAAPGEKGGPEGSATIWALISRHTASPSHLLSQCQPRSPEGKGRISPFFSLLGPVYRAGGEGRQYLHLCLSRERGRCGAITG